MDYHHPTVEVNHSIDEAVYFVSFSPHLSVTLDFDSSLLTASWLVLLRLYNTTHTRDPWQSSDDYFSVRFLSYSVQLSERTELFSTLGHTNMR